MFTKLLAQLLALHWIMLIPGRSCSIWKELHSNGGTLYQSMKVAGQSLENYIRTIDLLLQKLCNKAGFWMDKHLGDIRDWMEENTRALTRLVSDQAQSLWERLEKHTQDLSPWLSVSGTENPHEECSEKINQTDICLDQHAYIVPDEQLGEDLNFYDAPEMCANSVSSPLKDRAHFHIRFLKERVEMLERLWDSGRAAISLLLQNRNTAEEAAILKYIWDFLNMGPQTEELGSTEAMEQQVKRFGFVRWLEKRAGALEQWLQSFLGE